MEEIRCIYCNRSEKEGIKLNESDIIPDSLTNAKIKNNNVCEKDHNNDFSDLFESKIVNNLAFIRNHLNIKNKSKEYPLYCAKVKIREDVYKVKTSSENELVGNKIIRTEGTNIVLGPIDKVKKIKGSEGKIKEIDLNKEIIEKKLEFDLDTYVCLEMYRMVSKIAYEWFCKIKKINEKKEDFLDIIDYITTGKSSKKNIVRIVKNKEIYNFLSKECEYGSHFLISYIDENNNVCVLIYLFRIVLYEVKLCKNNVNGLDNYFCEEFLISKDKKFINGKILENVSDVFEAFNDEEIVKNGNINVLVLSKGKNLENFLKFNFMTDLAIHLKNITYFDNCNLKTDSYLIGLIKENLAQLLSFYIIDKKSLKRFVKEHDLKNDVNINIENTSVKLWHFLFILIKIGQYQNKNCIFTLESVIEEINNIIENIEKPLEKVEKIKSKLDMNNYKKYLKLGATYIENLK
ncbi:TPA: hypothetical protein KOZ01_001359 [Clostridioides difficile]|nr:hypothetical protein [Clostridioides difficile]EIS9216727.1 hypothetical protein [Clostridioides difficile]EIS9334512.1 hypothetical protein [Clostridioides difficile]EIS9370721.1 hypothetical protein [Clostridioides difficile]EIS9585056.1 hypothetical protein [Clostridioides difficile]EIS9613506.1 hypothetical protein [Clostridioides difficile]